MRSPWNGGSSSRRWRRCSGPSSRSTERGAEDRREHDVALAGVEQVRVAGEDLLDRLGIDGDHQHAVRRGQEREVVAAALVALVEEARRA